MLDRVVLENLLVIDVETAPVEPDLESLPKAMQDAWKSKARKHCPEDVAPQDYFFDRAAIFAEFGRIVCISVGYFLKDDKSADGLNFRIKSFSGREETPVLEGFIDLLNHPHFNKPEIRLAGHNIKEFDVPYICRRALVNGLMLPKILDISGRKPWETNLVDTMNLWKFGDYKNYTSLALLTSLFGLPTPKDDIDGSEVGAVFWHEDDVDRITRYCQKDVLAVAQLLLRFKGMPILENEDVTIGD